MSPGQHVIMGLDWTERWEGPLPEVISLGGSESFSEQILLPSLVFIHFLQLSAALSLLNLFSIIQPSKHMVFKTLLDCSFIQWVSPVFSLDRLKLCFFFTDIDLIMKDVFLDLV